MAYAPDAMVEQGNREGERERAENQTRPAIPLLALAAVLALWHISRRVRRSS